MSVFIIKVIALSTMFIDHAGLYFLPDLWFLRIMGRLSFILFAWLIANGARNTKDIKKYLLRLVILGVVSQYPFYLLSTISYVSNIGLNIGFTLSLGLIMIMVYKSSSSKYLKLFYSICILFMAALLNVDYGLAGILSILLFYVYIDRFDLILITQTSIYILFYTIPVLYKLAYVSSIIYPQDIMKIIQPIALISLVFIYFYNKKPGFKDGYIFYLVYPVHYVFMLFIKYMIK
jgi:hypothetical protein